MTLYMDFFNPAVWKFSCSHILVPDHFLEMAEDAPQSIITQVSRDSDSYSPCPGPINTKGMQHPLMID